MKLLLDTHYLIWMVCDRGRIGRADRAILERAKASLILSVISFWEIRIKWDSLDRHGRRKGMLDPVVAQTFAAQMNITIEPLDAEVAIAPLLYPIRHGDPFDRMLLVHAQQLGAKLLTRDRHLLGHPFAYAE